MNNSPIRTLTVLLLLFVAVPAYAYSFKISKVSWVGDALHIEVKTDAPDGTRLNIAMSDEKTGDHLVTESVGVVVDAGKFKAEGFGTDNNYEPLRAGHYWLSVAEVDRPLAFVGVPITVSKRPKQPGTKQKAPEDAARAAQRKDFNTTISSGDILGHTADTSLGGDSETADADRSAAQASSISELKQSWVDDVFRVEGKTNLSDGTWLNVSVQDNDGALAADEGFICTQVSRGRFVVEGFTKDGINPLPPGRYKLSIEPQNPLQSGFGFSAEKSITISKRPKFSKSRLAEVRAMNVANYANAKDNTAAATKSTDVSEFQRSESDMQLRHQAVKNTMDQLTSSRALRFDCNKGKAWIDPGLWQSSDAEDKENLARAIYETCSSQSIDIYDAQSAKKLARYGSVIGFRAY
jgi:hypothetical protein